RRGSPIGALLPTRPRIRRSPQHRGDTLSRRGTIRRSAFQVRAEAASAGFAVSTIAMPAELQHWHESRARPGSGEPRTLESTMGVGAAMRWTARSRIRLGAAMIASLSFLNATTVDDPLTPEDCALPFIGGLPPARRRLRTRPGPHDAARA